MEGKEECEQFESQCGVWGGGSGSCAVGVLQGPGLGCLLVFGGPFLQLFFLNYTLLCPLLWAEAEY